MAGDYQARLALTSDDCRPTLPMPLASHESMAYPSAVVKPPFTNLEEQIDKIVGRRTKVHDPLSVETGRKADAIAWRKSLGGIRVPRGVHRFRSHEEADDWLWRMIARPS